MFENLLENRYPFNNCVQFFVEGYWMQLESLHLTLGWFFIVLLTFNLIRQNIPLSLKLSVLFFALVIFNNPAYDLGGFKLNELFGIVSILYSLILVKSLRISTQYPVIKTIFVIFFIGILHGILTSIIYPELNEHLSTGFTRLAVHLKILVLVLNLSIVGSYLRNGIGLNVLMRYIVISGTFALLMYLLQGAILVGAGTLPYGTFIDAGFLGFPSFGSTSIERGHFGKFMTPLFPFFFYAMLAWRWWWCFTLFTLIFVINFSASAQVFFISFCLIALWKFSSLLKRKSVLFGLFISIVLTSIFVINYYEIFLGVFDKIYNLAFKGAEVGGRGSDVFLQYLEKYPLGIGYSGSTLRTAPGLPEINAAYFAFITQYSLLSPLVLGIYLFFTVKTLRVSRRSGLLAKTMSIGVLGSSIIFLTDILWFVPTIWLSYLIIWCESERKVSRSLVNTLTSVYLRPIQE